MYAINAELEKIDAAMCQTAYNLKAVKELSAEVNKGYDLLLNEKAFLNEKLMNLALEGADTLETAQQLKNVADFIFYLKFRKDLIEKRLQKLQSVHPSRINSISRSILPWDTEESLLSWKKSKPRC